MFRINLEESKICNIEIFQIYLIIYHNRHIINIENLNFKLFEKKK